MANCTINANTIQVFNNSNQKIFDAGVRMPTILQTYSGTLSFPAYTCVTAPTILGLPLYQIYAVDNLGYTLSFATATTASNNLLSNSKILSHLRVTDNLGFAAAKVPGVAGKWMFGNSVIYRTHLYAENATGQFYWLEMIYVFINSSGIFIKRKVGIKGNVWNLSQAQQIVGAANVNNGSVGVTRTVVGSEVTVDYKFHVCREI